MRIVVLGPPGAGKGTQAHRLSGVPLIATGDIFRQNVEEGTELGRKARSYMEAGELVPDEVVVEMVVGALRRAPRGFVLDGFPRTLPQAGALERELAALGAPLQAALAFRVDDELAVKRLAGRRTCSVCQRSYNVVFHPPRRPGRCDACGGELVQREDDREEIVRRRIEVYHRQTEPLLGFYRDRGLLREVDGEGTEDEVAARVRAALEDLRTEVAE
jgi:adenylate kinase